MLTTPVPTFRIHCLQVINHPEVQAVWICSPSQFHADQIKKCAKAGKHVFCEKPIATDLAGTIEAIKVSERTKGSSTKDTDRCLPSIVLTWPPALALVWMTPPRSRRTRASSS